MTKPGWSFPWQLVPKTKGTRFRVLVAVLPLQPLPGGKPVELRLYLKQWDEKAAAPYSWCLDLMKFAGDAPGATMDPFQPLQHVQIAEVDWPWFFSSWDAELSELLIVTLAKFKDETPPIQTQISAD